MNLADISWCCQFLAHSTVSCHRLRIKKRANVILCENIISDETGALTTEWVVLNAVVISLGIAAYGAFKIETDSSFAYSIDFADGSETRVSALNGLLALVAQTKLNTTKFVMCNFKSANFASESSTGDFNACQ